MVYLLMCLVLISVLLMVYGILSIFLVRSKTIDRIDVFINPIPIKKEIKIKEKKKGNLLKYLSNIIELFGNGINNINIMSRLKENNQKELIKADILLKGEEFIAIQLFLSVILGLTFYNLSDEMVVGFLFSLFGLILPKFYLTYKKNKRVKKFNDQLGDAIVLISNSLKVGHSFMQSIDTASKEMPEPISKELGKFLHETRLGASVETAFKSLLDRVESDDLSLLITAVNIQRQTGGNLAQILDTISKTIQERIKIKGEIKTLTAQGKLSGVIVTGLPFVIVGVVSCIDPEYLKPLYTTKLGLILLCVAFVNEVIGYIIINKIVKIDF